MPDNAKTVKITFTSNELERLRSLIADTAGDLEDDGREGNPDAQLLWKLLKQLNEAK